MTEPVPDDPVNDIVVALRQTEWPEVTMTQEIEGNEVVDSGFRMLLCPYCCATVPLATEDIDFREKHIDFHQDVLDGTFTPFL